MARFDVLVRVMPRSTLLDPQGQAVGQALTALGFAGVGDVRVGKAVAFQLDRPDEVAAQKDATAMCERFLANPVTEAFTVLVEGAS